MIHLKTGDEEEDLPVDASDQNQRIKISTLPLHLARSSRKWVSPISLNRLRRQFPEIRTTRWTSKELRRLHKNWSRIVRHHPEFSDARYAFGSGHEFESLLTPEQVMEKRSQYTKFNIMFRMAYKLRHRLICDIYAKCRALIYQKSFFFNSRVEIPPELEKRVKLELELGEPPLIIAYKYNVAPNVVLTIKRHPNRNKRFSWTEIAIADLKQSVRSTHDVDCLEDLRASCINWTQVCRFMIALRYSLEPEQCYNKWIRIMPESKKTKFER